MKKPRRELLPGCIFGYYLATTTTENCCTSLNDTKSKMTLYRLIQDAAKRDKMDKPQLITRRSLVQIRPPQPPSRLNFLNSTCFFVFTSKWAAPPSLRDAEPKSVCVCHAFIILVLPQKELEDLQGKNGHFCDFARFRLHCIQKISCLLPGKKRKTFPFYNKNVLAKTVFFCYTLANEYSCNRRMLWKRMY